MYIYNALKRCARLNLWSQIFVLSYAIYEHKINMYGTIISLLFDIVWHLTSYNAGII
jgi:hypothetical protein